MGRSIGPGKLVPKGAFKRSHVIMTTRHSSGHCPWRDNIGTGIFEAMDVASLIRGAPEHAHLTQAELAARAGTSQPAISRYEAAAASPSVETLDRLLASMGAKLHLSVTEAPRDLDVRTLRLAKIRTNRDLIRRAADRHHATNVQIFGSVARGEDGPDSDLDLLVDLDVRHRGLFPLMELKEELEQILGERVDIAPRDALAPHVAERALAEAVPL